MQSRIPQERPERVASSLRDCPSTATTSACLPLFLDLACISPSLDYRITRRERRTYQFDPGRNT